MSAARKPRLGRGPGRTAPEPAAPKVSAPESATPDSATPDSATPEPAASGRAGSPWGLLGRAGPLSLLLGPFVLLVGGVTMPRLDVAAAASAALLVTLVVLAGRHRIGWLRLLPGLLALASVTWSNWFLADPRDLSAALLAGLRVACVVVPGVVFAAFIDASALGDQLGQRLGMAPRPVLAMTAALQRLDTLSADWQELARARRVRGLGPGRSPVAQVRHYASMSLALLVSALRQAEQLAVAMEARGYGLLARPGHRRTWLRPAPWTRADTVLIGLCALFAALPWALALVL